MPQQDLISMQIAPADLAEIRGAVQVLQTKLMPHLQVLTGQERRELPKMGERTVAFVQKALQYGQQNPQIVPPFLDMAAFAVDDAAINFLTEVAQALHPLLDAVDDSITLAGSDAYQAALVFYAAARSAAKLKAPNAGTIYEDLSSRFPRPGKKAPAATPAA